MSIPNFLTIRKVENLPDVKEPLSLYLLPSLVAGTLRFILTDELNREFTNSTSVSTEQIQDLLESKVDKIPGMGLSQVSFTTALRDKLVGIQAEATKNQSDTYLLDRANQTGTQAMSTVTGLTQALNNKVDKEDGMGLSQANFTDALEQKLTGIQTGATKNQSDTYLLDRANQTGTQPMSTVTGLTEAIAGKVNSVPDMGLSEENYTIVDKTKLDGIEDGATRNNPDGFLLARENQTGVQPIDTVEGLPEAIYSKVDKVEGKQLSEQDFTTALKDKLDGIEQGATRNQTDTYLLNRANQTGKQDITTIEGLPEVLGSKVDKVEGKQLSQQDFTTTLKTKLDGVQSEATKNQTDAYLLNRMNQTGFQAMETVTNLIPTFNTKVGFSNGRFVGNSTELAVAKNDLPNQQQVFDSWLKISNGSNGLFPSIPAETTAWAFDPATQRVRNTTNSVSFIGAVSDRKFDTYELDVSIYSISTDDDTIGILLGFFQDETGKQYTLSVLRSPGGNANLYQVVYNYNQGSAGGSYVVADGNSLVQWGNGASGSLSKTDAAYVNNTPGWGNMGDKWSTDGSTRLWIKRQGNIFTIHTSQWQTPNTKDPATLLTVDLTSSPLLNKFVGPSSYGFCALSQQDSYWDVKSFVNPKDAIFDLSTKKVWTHTSTGWVESTTLSFADLQPNQLLVDEGSNRIYYITESKKVLLLNSTLVG